MSRFEWAVRAEFATQHLMHEQNIERKLPLEMYLSLGYDCQIQNPKLWDKIQSTYELQIARVLKRKMTDRRGFKYIPIEVDHD
jgi:hypothetical protein